MRTLVVLVAVATVMVSQAALGQTSSALEDCSKKNGLPDVAECFQRHVVRLQGIIDALQRSAIKSGDTVNISFERSCLGLGRAPGSVSGDCNDSAFETNLSISKVGPNVTRPSGKKAKGASAK